ncbi:helix-turn-helix domain-containing protein [Streptomyces sp. SID8379]|uniref:helix-turn-helix domain-containing protein n=1 Tax=unclassified Streptomyces TaxID=2593676 RepID=UPI0003707D23|nr:MULTISPECIES: AraC family transcriptional regulator [unclassified Streptomyces]MYW64623.1 helix-turn-helix domain-containing protein [Streptomyces sp. SID8379]
MCRPGWALALVAAQRLTEFARLRRVRDRIDREYAQPLNVEALASGVDMAAGELSRRFEAAYGTSPYGYLTALRVQRAVRLLHHGGLGAEEVGRVVGCASDGVFRGRFTELVGVPPRAAQPVRIREAPTTAPVLA